MQHGPEVALKKSTHLLIILKKCSLLNIFSSTNGVSQAFISIPQNLIRFMFSKLKSTIGNLNVRKSTGFDEITARIILEISKCVERILLYIHIQRYKPYRILCHSLVKITHNYDSEAFVLYHNTNMGQGRKGRNTVEQVQRMVTK